MFLVATFFIHYDIRQFLRYLLTRSQGAPLHNVKANMMF